MLLVNGLETCISYALRILNAKHCAWRCKNVAGFLLAFLTLMRCEVQVRKAPIVLVLLGALGYALHSEGISGGLLLLSTTLF